MSSLFHSLSCSISSQSLQYSLLEAAMSCCTAPSSGNIWPWTEYHRLLSGGCGWVIFKFNLPDSPSHTANVDLYIQLAQLFLVFVYCVVFVYFQEKKWSRRLQFRTFQRNRWMYPFSSIQSSPKLQTAVSPLSPQVFSATGGFCLHPSTTEVNGI